MSKTTTIPDNFRTMDRTTLEQVAARLLYSLDRIIYQATTPMSDGDIDLHEVAVARAAIAAAEGGEA